jgi:hypothetical protein
MQSKWCKIVTVLSRKRTPLKRMGNMLISAFFIKLDVILDSLTWQEKHNIHKLSVKIKFTWKIVVLVSNSNRNTHG